MVKIVDNLICELVAGWKRPPTRSERRCRALARGYSLGGRESERGREEDSECLHYKL